MSKRVRTLLRVSSKQQLHDDDIPVQRAEAERYIAKNPEWIFDREYIEKAVSAYKNSAENRKVLQQIMEDARAKQFDILLTYMSDRIGRQEEYSFYVAALNRLGIEVWTIRDGQLKTQEHVDKLLNFIRFWQNEGESRKTGMRVRDARREMVKAGKFTGGRAPYGYCLVPSGQLSNHGRLLKKLEIAEEAAAVVKRIYSLAVYQGMGYEKIAKTLNAESIPAPGAGQWKPGAIAGILKNPVYTGYYAGNRRAGDGSHARLDPREWVYSENQIAELVIIPRSMWERAQRIREERKNKINASRERSLKLYEEQYQVPFSTRGKLALAGLACCGYCGKRLKNGSYCNHWTTKSGEKKVSFTGRYLCPDKCRERSCYSQDYLESIVSDIVAGYLEQMKTIDVAKELGRMRQQKKQGFEKELEQIEKKRKSIRLDIKTLEDKIPEAVRGSYCFSAEKLSKLIEENMSYEKELEKKAGEIRGRMAEADLQNKEPGQFTRLRPDWKKEFESADPAARRMLLFTLIEKILVKDNEITIKFKLRPEDFLQETDGFGVSQQGL